VVKTGVGYLSGVDEAELMRFVKKHTSIPVPEVFCVHVFGNRYYIFMSYIEGNTLDNVWLDLLTEDKEKIANQLRAFIMEMRALKFPHGESLGSLATRRCKDIRRSSFRASFPILSESQFNAFLVSLLRNQQSEYIAQLASSLRDDHKIVLTHSDLHPRNIIIRDGSVVGLIDWEAGGWYPEYWEYVKGLNNVEEVKDWWRYLIRIVGNYALEWSFDVLIDREIDYKKHCC
jgi:aminoglycoside phosphotransferase (APT) family kinase protein